jgi:hypothetical protein
MKEITLNSNTRDGLSAKGAGCALPRLCVLDSGQLGRVVGDSAS